MDHQQNTYLIIPEHTNTQKTHTLINQLILNKKRRRKRRKICMKSTLQNYYNRITQGPLQHHLHELEGVYLSTFRMFSTENDLRDKCMNNAFILMQICRERGINVKGVTSECKVHGVYVSTIDEDPSRENTKVVYVDNYNYFTNHQAVSYTHLTLPTILLV